ncbi:MAG: hypothetical protein Q8K82_24865 [Gemmatimonadaceae bacterium]|nr:hypothetical protein [Gemmatimonadaceae bacterium]
MPTTETLVRDRSVSGGLASGGQLPAATLHVTQQNGDCRIQALGIGTLLQWGTTAGIQAKHAKRFPREVITRALYVPTYRAPVTEALAGDDGTLWLRWDPVTSSDLYSVLGVDGRIVAHVHASSRVRLRWVSRTTAWGEERDEDDVPTLVRYRVTSAK